MEKSEVRRQRLAGYGFIISGKFVGRSFADRSPTVGGRALAKASGTPAPRAEVRLAEPDGTPLTSVLCPLSSDL